PVIFIIGIATGYFIQFITAVIFGKGGVPAIKIGVVISLHVTAAAPALITDAPEFDFPGFILTVLAAEISQRAIAVVGHVFNPVGHFSGRSAAHIVGDIGFGIQQLGKSHKFMD